MFNVRLVVYAISLAAYAKLLLALPNNIITINSINTEPAESVDTNSIGKKGYVFPLLYETRFFRPTSYFSPTEETSPSPIQNFVISSRFSCLSLHIAFSILAKLCGWPVRFYR